MRSGSKVTFSLNRIFAVLLAALLLLGIGLYSSYRVQANHALRQAKNVALSLRLLSVYSQSDNYLIFDHSRSSGLSEAAEAELMELANITGGVTLKHWDSENDVPVEFTYTYKQCIVTYRATEATGITWEVDYRLPVLRYS